MAGDQLQKAETSDDTVTISSIVEDLVAADENSISEAAKKLEISEDEETLIIRMFNLYFRWSLIAGRIPGRSAEEIEKYWNSRHSTNQNK
ncbi:hypothetical protein SASPL_124401 [Salvia splendens]|uniref:Myb-like domain-containing protein n=1 Tax=Salvia splendens TaxID=180675 RepID=A0A8X8XRN8_SALSN|nr:hypothetical protein SASPL_124401 [Salvia splendens]